MLYLALPIGSAHGWGICGKYVTREMHALTGGQARLISHDITLDTLGDEFEFHAIAPLALSQQQLVALTANGTRPLDGPLLNSIGDKRNIPFVNLRGTRTLGYTFFEENIFQAEWIENARRNFDLIATGSSWCTDVLKSYGLANVHTVLQGVDRRLFFPAPPGSPLAEREYLKDAFVIFSGGKFELRKGQDLVIRAVKVLQDRHKDVLLINSWYNMWQQSFDTMQRSPHLKFPAASGNYFEVINALLRFNGLDPARTLTLAPRNNALMARIYRNSDVGLFPNRCEGGTNLVLMEYMACGKPVVATGSTGHADIINPANALPIAIEKELPIRDATGHVANWPEPSLDSVIAQLEYAYQNRPALAPLAQQAAADMEKLTWRETAAAFHRLLTT
jgi:glycosyltransferase involved in cell wall biosynthesis